MRLMMEKRSVVLKRVVLAVIVLMFAGCADKYSVPLHHTVHSSCTYYSLQSAQCLDKKRFMEQIEPYQVIFIGDHHQSVNAHKEVVELLNGLSDDGYTLALANEWFSPRENMLLEQYVDGKLDSNGSKALEWGKRTGYDFNLSEPIYSAVIANHGKLYGINMDKAFKTMVSEQNITAMNDEQRRFYESLDLNVSVHQQLLSPFFSHCHHLKKGETQEECTARMYRVQVAWDSMMGEESAKLAQNLKANEKLIVFVGAMHLESGLGVNLRFSRMTNIPFVTVLPMPRSEEAQQALSVDLGSSDLIYLYND